MLVAMKWSHTAGKRHLPAASLDVKPEEVEPLVQMANPGLLDGQAQTQRGDHLATGHLAVIGMITRLAPCADVRRGGDQRRHRSGVNQTISSFVGT